MYVTKQSIDSLELERKLYECFSSNVDVVEFLLNLIADKLLANRQRAELIKTQIEFLQKKQQEIKNPEESTTPSIESVYSGATGGSPFPDTLKTGTDQISILGFTGDLGAILTKNPDVTLTLWAGGKITQKQAYMHYANEIDRLKGELSELTTASSSLQIELQKYEGSRTASQQTESNVMKGRHDNVMTICHNLN